MRMLQRNSGPSIPAGTEHASKHEDHYVKVAFQAEGAIKAQGS